MADFTDFNFKLVIINELLEKGSFASDVKQLTKKPESGLSADFGYDKPNKKIEVFLQNIELTKDDLAAVERLVFDGGNEIYHLMMPFWDGEDDRFDISSVDGFENLPNLRKVFNISMIQEAEIARFRAAGIVVK